VHFHSNFRNLRLAFPTLDCVGFIPQLSRSIEGDKMQFADRVDATISDFGCRPIHRRMRCMTEIPTRVIHVLNSTMAKHDFYLFCFVFFSIFALPGFTDFAWHIELDGEIVKNCDNYLNVWFLNWLFITRIVVVATKRWIEERRSNYIQPLIDLGCDFEDLSGQCEFHMQI